MKIKLQAVCLTAVLALFLSGAGCGDESKAGPGTGTVTYNKFGIQEAHYSIWNAGDVYECGTVEQGKAMFASLDDLHVKNFRYTIFWYFVERNADGQYDWGPHDQLIAELSSKGLDISIMIEGVNSSYCDPGPETPAIVSDAEYHAAWINFIEAVVTRYGDKVKRWEIGNEEDSDQYWKPAADPAAYSAFLISTSQKIRSIQPDAFIIMGGVTLFPSDEDGYYGSREFLAACFDEGVLDHVDAVGIHPYRSIPEFVFDWGFYPPEPVETTFEGEINSLKTMIAGYKEGIELWNTESGFVNFDYADIDNQNKKLYSQVKLISRFMLVDYAAGLKGLTYFRLRVNHAFPGTVQPMFQGLIEEDTTYRRPAFTAMKSISDIIGPSDVVYVKTINTTGKIDTVDTAIRIEVYSKNDKNIIAYWLPEEIDDVQKETRRITFDINGVPGSGYRVRDILKTVNEAADYTVTENSGTVTFDNLPVTDYPFIMYQE